LSIRQAATSTVPPDGVPDGKQALQRIGPCFTPKDGSLLLTIVTGNDGGSDEPE
jgi:hypothetical protein